MTGTPEDSTFKKVRVNGKFDPQNTKVGLPQNMREFKNTTVARDSRTGEWETIEAEQFVEFDKDENVDACSVFLQEPRERVDERSGRPINVCFKAIDPWHGREAIIAERATAMTKRQRNIFDKGCKTAQQRDVALNACVQQYEFDQLVEREPQRLMLGIAPPNIANKSEWIPANGSEIQYL